MKLSTHLQQSQLLYFNKSNDEISVHENTHYVWLAFEQVVQSIMLKRVPEKLTLPHHYFLTLPLLFIAPKKIVELGLGGGNLVRFLDKMLPNSVIASVEHSQSVINCFNEYFNPSVVNQPIFHTSFQLWLIQQKKQKHDWVIYDIYQSGEEFDIFTQQISRVVDRLDDHCWLSINLPDLTEHQLNMALLHLSSIKQQRTMRYFMVPNYKNVIIHLLPSQSNFIDNPVLPSYMAKRWKMLWQNGTNVR